MTGNNFESWDPTASQKFFNKKNKGFDRSKNSVTQQAARTIYNRSKPPATFGNRQFMTNRKTRSKTAKGIRRNIIDPQKLAQEMEIRESMAQLNEFDHTHGSVR